MTAARTDFDAVVIGGGAAGLMAAVTAARRGLAVAVVEPNAVLGRKLRITGKGRCNVTNDCDVREALENITTNAKFLTSAMTAFPPSAAIEFFEELGVPLKTERGKRVFPRSDDANDVADALERELNLLGATVIRAAADDIAVRDGAVCSVMAAGRPVTCRAAVLATGGVSYPATGSAGAGHVIARRLGHTVTELRASLVPLVCAEDFCAEMQGLSLRNVRLTVRGKTTLFSDFGELLFTHYGLSGPLTLSASAHMRGFDECYTAEIDLKPALNDRQLDERLQRDLREHANNDFKNALGNLLPRLMIPVVVRLSGIDPNKKAHSVTRDERCQLFRLIRAFSVTVTGARPVDEAVVTAGGVVPRELVPATMESKIVRNLHFAGEIIDADAYTGGFNLQIAWATAFCAGTRMLTEER